MSTLVQGQYPQQVSETQIDVYEEPRRVPIWEQAMITGWLLVTFVELPMGGPLRYLFVLAIMAYTVLHFDDILKLLLKAWPILLLPIFGFFSFIWADYSSAAMREGIFYLITVLFPIVFAARVELRILLRCYFFTAALTVLWGLQYWGEYSGGGHYTSKNYLALHMTFASFFFITQLLQKDEHSYIRWLAALLLPISITMIYQANSATAFVLCVAGVIGLIMVRVFWLSLASMRYMRGIILMTFGGLVAVITLVVVNLSTNTIVADGLEMLGKDTTLTGRTAMWSVGEVVVEERPILGVGLASFWQYDVGLAQTINENDHRVAGTVLTFHNSYLEVRVHLGLIGLCLYLITLAWVLLNVVRQWFGPPSVEASAILIITLITLAWSFTESWLWRPLNGATMLFYIGALAAISSQRRQYLGRAKVHIKESDS